MSIHQFYEDHEVHSVEEKIKVLEKQLQEFPNHQMPRDKRLMMLERQFNKMIAYKPKSSEKKVAKWADKYRQINDQSVDGNIGTGRIQLQNKESEMYNPYDGRSNMEISRDKD